MGDAAPERAQPVKHGQLANAVWEVAGKKWTKGAELSMDVTRTVLSTQAGELASATSDMPEAGKMANAIRANSYYTEKVRDKVTDRDVIVEAFKLVKKRINNRRDAAKSRNLKKQKGKAQEVSNDRRNAQINASTQLYLARCIQRESAAHARYRQNVRRRKKWVDGKVVATAR